MRAIGVDIGGTFTDTVLVGDDDVHAIKTSSTADFIGGLSTGIDAVCEVAGIDPSDVTGFNHGSTIAVNALIERTGAKTAIVTTAGFSDVLEIGEGYRGADLLYAPCNDRSTPLIPRRHRFGVEERIDADGEVVTPLNVDDLDRVIDEILAADLEAVAVCLLHAYRNPEHERAIVERFEERTPQLDVSRSSMVSPEIREYSRTATTVADAYLKPELSAYLNRLEDELDNAGIEAPVAIMKSDGGLARPEIAASRPVTQVISGPVAGVNAARYLAGQRGLENILTFDMGGTSCDVAAVADGESIGVAHREIQGLKINGPFTHVETVGAGGGSIARLDEVGALRVGPDSAGADPGPACYGRGGELPTVTDADLVLGILNPETFAGGTVTLDSDAAEGSIREHVAEPMGVSVEAAAAAIRDVIDTKMASATRVTAVNEGLDPREFALVGFGGAGPVHTCNVAAELDIDEVVFPNRPGVLSALGLLVSDIRHEYAMSLVETVESVDPDRIEAGIDELTERADRELESEGVAPDDRAFEISFDAMYEGQAHYLNVPYPKRTITDTDLPGLAAAFESAHDHQYGFVDDRNPVELVNLRVTAVGATPTPPSTEREGTATEPPTPLGHREVVLGADERVETPYYNRDDLGTGHELTGPAVVESDNTTIWIPPSFDGSIDRFGNLVATREVRQ
ncbi:MAG: hydantoinase/oxoprolinase family protein [Halobacteriota archaeon]|uniref:hydantoinase/oxoprolinase family protein n=1 Tax=Natronomonas sp. TaxID=2184060 RepID=UPI00397560D0